MRTIIGFTLILSLSSSHKLIAQLALSSHTERWSEHNCNAEFSGDTIHLTNTSGATAFLWTKDFNFKNGVIELDIKGKDVRGESFVGVAFHALDNETYDAIYFRPFNFRDAERKDRAVQYIAKPHYDWDLLREKHPGRYEHAIVPDTDPNDWFHVKIVVRHPRVSVYLNRSDTPTLEVTQLSKRKNGQFALWIDGREGWFKNVTINNNRD